MATIVLHQWEMSPFCNKARRCLAFKGLKYEVRDYNGLQARKAAALSPVGKLPVMDHDDRRIQDSSHIAAFLDQHHPAKPRIRWTAKRWPRPGCGKTGPASRCISFRSTSGCSTRCLWNGPWTSSAKAGRPGNGLC